MPKYSTPFIPDENTEIVCENGYKGLSDWFKKNYGVALNEVLGNKRGWCPKNVYFRTNLNELVWTSTYNAKTSGGIEQQVTNYLFREHKLATICKACGIENWSIILYLNKDTYGQDNFLGNEIRLAAEQSENESHFFI